MLLPHSIQHDDGAHDAAHLQRVWKNALAIQATEGGDLEILAAAVLLHDCVAVEKDSPQRALASWLAAEKASRILDKLDWPQQRIAAVTHAIESHSYSGGIAPESLEAKILQDADRFSTRSASSASRAVFTPPAGWAVRCMTLTMQSAKPASWMTSASPWTIFIPSS